MAPMRDAGHASSLQSGGGPGPPWLGRPLLTACVLCILGVVLGRQLPVMPVAAWFLLALGTAVAMLVMLARRRWRGTLTWGLLALVPLMAMWTSLRGRGIAADDIAHVLHDHPVLVQVRGHIADPPRIAPSQRGHFARWQRYQPIQTSAPLELSELRDGDHWRPVRGRVLLRSPSADTALYDGRRIEALGWLSRPSEPSNPGQADVRDIFAARGLAARLMLPESGNWTPLDDTPAWRSWRSWREGLAGELLWSLRLGMHADSPETSLLQTLLLGTDRWALGDLETSFRRTGLTHLLSISGAHLAILLGVVWIIAHMLAGPAAPRRASLVVLIVLALYLFALPLSVPIVRAGIMAALLCLASLTGRRARVIDLLALAAVFALILQPDDLVSAGFQLSFGITAALLLFTAPLSQRLYATPLDAAQLTRFRHLVKRRLADYAAANLVAFLVSLPIVAHHFHIISPLAAVVSFLTLPLVASTLMLGYAKIALGLVLPSLGLALAPLAAWCAGALIAVVDALAAMPIAAVRLPADVAPGLAWTLAALALVLAWLSGCFTQRRAAMALAMTLLAGWASISVLARPAGPDAAMRLSAVSVGDGSCFILQTPALARGGGNGHVLMFDCGSRQYFDLGIDTVPRSLDHLGIRRIDTLIVSHADLDHFNGVLDLADRVPIGKVLMSPHTLAARQFPDSATHHLIAGLEARGIPIESVTAGAAWSLGSAPDAPAAARVLWPPADLVPRGDNETSIVLTINLGTQRLMLCGDIEDRAMNALMAREPDLAASVMDLPHHGAMVRASPAWLARVSPRMVLQSSTTSRLKRDTWAPLLAGARTERWATAEWGFVSLWMDERDQIVAVPCRARRVVAEDQ